MGKSEKMKKMQKDRYCEQCGKYIGTYSDIDWESFWVGGEYICDECWWYKHITKQSYGENNG